MSVHAAWVSIVTLASLAACSAPTAPQAAGVPISALDSGARIYNGNCVACHGQDARGIAGVYPSLVGSPVLLGDPAELAIWVIKGRRPPSMPAGRYPTMMAQFGWLKPQDAAVLFTYLRTSFGNSAPAVDSATVVNALAVQP